MGYVELTDCTDDELLKEMLHKLERSEEEVQAAWYEFFNRFDPILAKAVRSTYRRHLPQVWLSPEDLRDLVQQIYLKLAEDDYRALREFRSYDENSLKYFLYDVARHKTIDCIRLTKTVRRPHITKSLSEPVYRQNSTSSYADLLCTNEADPEEQYLQKEQFDRVRAVIDEEPNRQLRERDHRIFDAYCDGYTISEIAARKDIGLKRSSVGSRIQWLLKRAWKRFYKKMPDTESVAYSEQS